MLIAGGVGITPLIAKIRYLTDVSWPGDIYLLYSVKTEQDIIFREELAGLQRRHPNLHVIITLTRDDNPGWTGERGRITPDLLSRAIPNLAARRVHLCGPTEMTEPTRQMLRELGVPEAAIEVESFASPSRTAAATPMTVVAPTEAVVAADGAPTTVEFARSGKSAPLAAGETVLEAAEALGIQIRYDCRAGICGQCKIKLLAGHVVMEAEDALDALDRANSVILSCQARCLDEVVVDA